MSDNADAKIADLLKNTEQDGFIDVVFFDGDVLHVSYNDMTGIRTTDSGLHISFVPVKTGQQALRFWPWSHIVEFANTTNSNEVAEAIQDIYNEYRIEQFAEKGIKDFEQLVNKEESDPRIVDTSGNPCGADHSEAVESLSGTWTCLTCGSQWRVDY